MKVQTDGTDRSIRYDRKSYHSIAIACGCTNLKVSEESRFVISSTGGSFMPK